MKERDIQRVTALVPVIVYAIAIPLAILGGETGKWVGATMVSFLIGWSARGIVDMRWITQELQELRELVRR